MGHHNERQFFAEIAIGNEASFQSFFHGFLIFGSAWCESRSPSPSPGKCLPQPRTPSSSRPFRSSRAYFTASFGLAEPRHRPGLAEQGRDHLRRRRIHLVHAVLGHDHDCAARHKPRLRGSGGGRSGVRGSVIGTAGRGRREVAGPGRQGHEVGVIVTSPASGCSSAAESVVLDDGTVQVVPEHPVRIH